MLEFSSLLKKWWTTNGWIWNTLWQSAKLRSACSVNLNGRQMILVVSQRTMFWQNRKNLCNKSTIVVTFQGLLLWHLEGFIGVSVTHPWHGKTQTTYLSNKPNSCLWLTWFPTLKWVHLTLKIVNRRVPYLKLIWKRLLVE